MKKKVKYLDVKPNWNQILDDTFEGKVTKQENTVNAATTRSEQRRTKRCT
jgi:hypothetical protein